jgi:hypothetical protein
MRTIRVHQSYTQVMVLGILQMILCSFQCSFWHL